MVAFAEGMDIEAGASAQVGQHGLALRAREILGRGQFDVAGLALEHTDLEPRPFGQRGIVGETLAPLGRRAPVDIEQR